MGRTNPTYRDWLRRTEADCQPFRRALRRQYQGDFDRLFEHADRYADAAGYLNRPDPTFALLLSVLLAQEHDLRRLRERLDAVESPRAGSPDDGI